MFGTLMYDLRHNEPTFVENNPEAVINRNRRAKPHIACELCRARKLRCNGNPNGCDRCKATCNSCKYPTNRSVIRKRKQSIPPAKDQAQPRQSVLDDTTTPQSPIFSDHFNLDPATKFQTSNAETEKTLAMAQWHWRNSLPSPGLDLSQYPTDLIWDLVNIQNEMMHEQDQIDQLLASCSLLSPNGTIDGSYLEMADFVGRWREPVKDMSYFENADDSGNAEASYQVTYPQDFDMMDTQEIFDSSSSTPCLSPWSPNTLLDENFSANKSVPMPDIPSSKPQPSRKPTPVSYKMSAPAATGPLSALPETNDNTHEKKSECRCLRVAAHLLKQLGNEGGNTEQPTIDGLLNCCREAIKGCESILSCTLCKSRSETMMLLAMAAQYLSNICEKTVRSYVDVVQQPQSSNHMLPGGASVWFRSYRIESASERNQVLGCLVTSQLTELGQLIGKIKARVGTRKAELAPLLGAEWKIQCMRAMLMQCESHRGLRRWQ